MTARDDRDTDALVADARARRTATEGLTERLRAVVGYAEDEYRTLAVRVGLRGELRELWLRDDALAWGPELLGELITEAARAAAADATQRGYDLLSRRLGDVLTARTERLGEPAPARDTGLDAVHHISADEFRTRRTDRLQAAGRHGDARDTERDAVLSFDPAMLRSDR